MKFKAFSDENRRVSDSIRQLLDRLDAYASRYKPHTAFEFEIVKRQPRVSSPARKYYYGVVLPCFLDAYFYERDEADIVHRHLKILYFGIKPDKHGIYREREIPSVFSDNPTVKPQQRTAFVDAVIRKCAQSPDNPVVVPGPGG